MLEMSWYIQSCYRTLLTMLAPLYLLLLAEPQTSFCTQAQLAELVRTQSCFWLPSRHSLSSNSHKECIAMSQMCLCRCQLGMGRIAESRKMALKDHSVGRLDTRQGDMTSSCWLRSLLRRIHSTPCLHRFHLKMKRSHQIHIQ